MSGQSDTAKEHPAPISFSRDRLLPSNRRLRHLKGISIRNLTFTPTTGRSRGKTIDDDALPFTLKSPTKVRAQRESAELQHSRSSSDLRRDGSPKRFPHGAAPKTKQTASETHPGIKKLRRRSTMSWADITPFERQRKLENVNRERLADTFFSLHVKGESEPIYISETVSRAMNPNFQFFDLDPCGPSITRLDTTIVKVWAKTNNMEDFQYVIEWTVQLKHLTYLGKTLESFRHPLPSNCVVFHLPDGVYTSFVEVPENFSEVSLPAVNLGGQHPLTQPTSSYDQLMQLATLDACIQDALATRDKIKQDIESVLKENQSKLAVINSVPEAANRLRNIEGAVAMVEREVAQARKRKKQVQATVKDINAGMQEGRRVIAQGKEDITEGKTKLVQDRERIQHLEEDITNQRRRVCEDLLEIFPIEPLPDRQLAFTIRGLHLPNSDFSNCDEDKAAAALGYVAQVVQRLQMYLNRPVPYPVTPRASTSTIEDPVSMTTGPRTYPLFIKAAVRYRFEYGVFLLNKNIEILANWLGLRLLDIRQTLPNLKYLLYVATAGKGELPARKTGGIRGLYGHLQAPRSAQEVSNSLSSSDLAISQSGDMGQKDAQRSPLVLKANGSANLAHKGRNPAALASSKLREAL